MEKWSTGSWGGLNSGVYSIFFRCYCFLVFLCYSCSAFVNKNMWLCLRAGRCLRILRTVLRGTLSPLAPPKTESPPINKLSLHKMAEFLAEFIHWLIGISCPSANNNFKTIYILSSLGQQLILLWDWHAFRVLRWNVYRALRSHVYLSLRWVDFFIVRYVVIFIVRYVDMFILRYVVMFIVRCVDMVIVR